MKPDYLFIITGAGVSILATYLLGKSLFDNRKRSWLPALLWACFAAGLLVQGLAPHLKTENRRFQVPAPNSTNVVFNPKPIVERERSMNMLAALLTVSATAGLALQYKKQLISGQRAQEA
jgi:hypothetical protein